MRTALLLLCSLLAAVGAVEIFLRASHAFNARLSWNEPDPWIGWRFTPRREYWFFLENDHEVTGRINAAGWRDVERTLAKPAGTTRVAVIGDSYVEAFQVELDSTFVAVAERALNERGGRRYEVMNFGRSGVGPAEAHLVLQRDVTAFQPDAVVLLFTPNNDVDDVNPATAWSRLRPFYTVDARDSLVLDASFRDTKGYRLRAVVNPLKQRSALVSLVAERFNARAATGRDGGDRASSRLTPTQTLMTARPDSVRAANYALAKRVVAEIARACLARDVEFVLMSVPVFYLPHDIAAARAVDPTLDPAAFDRDFAQMGDSLGFRTIPLTAAFAAHSERTGERLHWAHWNYRGHRLAGRTLADSLASFLAAPAGPAN